jgi:hypothetical protein
MDQPNISPDAAPKTLHDGDLPTTATAGEQQHPLPFFMVTVAQFVGQHLIAWLNITQLHCYLSGTSRCIQCIFNLWFSDRCISLL